MIYLATPSSAAVQTAMADGRLGQLVTHRSANLLVPGATWALDNARVVLVNKRPATDPNWSEAKWLTWVERYAGAPDCLFAVVPDEVGDAAATDRLWEQYAPIVRAWGYRPAYVTQNGCTAVPADAGAVFTGGDDAWKLGHQARDLARAAAARGLWTHMGRVNTRRRIRLAARDGYDSVDGTCLAWGPDENLPRILRFMAEANAETSLALDGAVRCAP